MCREIRVITQDCKHNPTVHFVRMVSKAKFTFSTTLASKNAKKKKNELKSSEQVNNIHMLTTYNIDINVQISF